MASDHLGDRLAHLRRLADLTQEELAEKSGVSVDVIRKLEQHRKHSARLPTLHALATGLGVELTGLMGDPPAVAQQNTETPELVALRRAIMPSQLSPPVEPPDVEPLTLELLRAEIADGWTLYHSAQFGELMRALPGIIADARLAVSVGWDGDNSAAYTALGKALQLGGHLSIRLSKTDLALAALERALEVADEADDPLLEPMLANSIAWAYQRQDRLEDARIVASVAAEKVKATGLDTAERLRVWGGLRLSAATSTARQGDYEQASAMLADAEKIAGELSHLPPPKDSKLVSVFSRSAVRIERVRLATQYGRPQEALDLAAGMRLSADTPPSWRTWLLLDTARAYTDLGDATNAVKQLETLRRREPDWMRHHNLAIAIVSDLWSTAPQAPGVRKLAEFLGIIS
ncbi:MAG TPA: helix-turn-helix transcriptional regulator [Mycobacteriales bacterium]|nr:helix-turn-helix transcriptional regulator [Mycobacteriales bacterium]